MSISPTIVAVGQLRPSGGGWRMLGSFTFASADPGSIGQASAQDYRTQISGTPQFAADTVLSEVASSYRNNGITLYYAELWEQLSGNQYTVRVITAHSPI